MARRMRLTERAVRNEAKADGEKGKMMMMMLMIRR